MKEKDGDKSCTTGKNLPDDRESCHIACCYGNPLVFRRLGWEGDNQVFPYAKKDSLGILKGWRWPAEAMVSLFHR